MKAFILPKHPLFLICQACVQGSKHDNASILHLNPHFYWNGMQDGLLLFVLSSNRTLFLEKILHSIAEVFSSTYWWCMCIRWLHLVPGFHRQSVRSLQFWLSWTSCKKGVISFFHQLQVAQILFPALFRCVLLVLVFYCGGRWCLLSEWERKYDILGLGWTQRSVIIGNFGVLKKIIINVWFILVIVMVTVFVQGVL